MDTDSPKLHSILTLEPPPLLKVYGVMDWLFIFIEKRILNKVKTECLMYLIKKIYNKSIESINISIKDTILLLIVYKINKQHNLFIKY